MPVKIFQSIPTLSHKFPPKCSALFATLTLFSLIGCATQHAQPTSFAVSEADQYAPVNLIVQIDRASNMNRLQHQFHSEMVSYLHQAITESGLFSSLETSHMRWPITLKIDYSFEVESRPLDFVSMVASAFTLMLLPSKRHETHVMEVEVLKGPFSVNSHRYTKLVDMWVAAYRRPSVGRSEALKAMLNEMYADLEKDQSVPRLGDLQHQVAPNSEEKSI